MRLWSDNFEDGRGIPSRHAFCAPAEGQPPITMSANINPHLAWTDAPTETRSFAVVCHDPDVPSVGDDVNQAGKTVAHTLARVDFYHWLLWNLPADTRSLNEGAYCDGVTPRGKSGPEAGAGSSHGLNDYTGWFAGDPDMAGQYYGYDGPCPPWNDERLHHYVFTVYALNVDSLALGAGVTGAELLAAIEGHVLASAKLTGTYTLNPALL